MKNNSRSSSVNPFPGFMNSQVAESPANLQGFNNLKF